MYFYRNRDRFSNWQVVIIYPSRNTEQGDTTPYNNLLNSDRVNRIYLNELGNIRELPLEVAVMLLTTVNEEQAATEARYLLQRTQREVPESSTQGIIELITTIIAYRFEQLSRTEVETMLGITFEETRFYQDIKREGIEEGRAEGKRSLILRQLTRKIGELPTEVRSQVENLSIEQLENLCEALLDFDGIVDLETWLGNK